MNYIVNKKCIVPGFKNDVTMGEYRMFFEHDEEVPVPTKMH